MRILYVEDAPVSIHVLEQIARLLGHELVVATTGAEGLVLADRAPDLIFMDISLSDVDGLTLTRQIRARYPAVPIIAATAHVADEDRARCLAAGCSGYVGKPYRIPALVELIQSYDRSGFDNAPELPDQSEN
jgi:CheY-like chemotaxis protein